MFITEELLRKNTACRDHVDMFACLHPNGFYPTAHNLLEAHDHGVDVFQLAHLLPLRGPNGMLHFCLLCARRVQHLAKDARVKESLDITEHYALGEGTEEDRKTAERISWKAYLDSGGPGQHFDFTRDEFTALNAVSAAHSIWCSPAWLAHDVAEALGFSASRRDGHEGYQTGFRIQVAILSEMLLAN